jgi:hypothetical protein
MVQIVTVTEGKVVDVGVAEPHNFHATPAPGKNFDSTLSSFLQFSKKELKLKHKNWILFLKIF